MPSGVVAVGLLAGLTGCSSSGADGAAGGKISLVASTDVWGDVAQQVGGDLVDVTSIITDPAADPHSYEADAKVKLELSRASVVVENGGGYDDFVGTLLDSLDDSGKPAVVDAVQVSGKGAADGAQLNEHVWYDFPTVAKVADAIAAELGRADSANAAAFRTNAAAFAAKLQPLQAQEAAVKAAHAGTGVAVTEPVPLYLLQACGLTDETPQAFSEAIEEGTDVSASTLAQTLDLFTDRKVALLVYNEQTAGPETERVLSAAKSAGVGVVPVTETLPDGQDYLSWMTANLDAVSAAL